MNLNSNRRNKPQPRLRARLREATQVAILDAAEEAFARDGVHEARMETIARAAGVAVGTLYNHFADRDALLDALLKSRCRRLSEELDRALEVNAGRPFDEQLRVIVDVASTLTFSEGFMRMLIDAEGMHLSKKVFQPAKFMREIRTRLDVLVRRGIAQRVVRAEDANYFPWFMLGCIRANSLRRLKGESTEPLEQQREALMRFLKRGLQVTP